MTAGREAIAVFESLAETRARMAGEFAMALTNLGTNLRCCGRLDESCKVLLDAVQGLRLSAQNLPPIAFSRHLALALWSLSISLRQSGRFDEAVQIAQTPSAEDRKMAALEPVVFLPDLAMGLATLRDCLTAANRFDDTHCAGTRGGRDDECLGTARILMTMHKVFEAAPIAHDGLVRLLHIAEHQPIDIKVTRAFLQLYLPVSEESLEVPDQHLVQRCSAFLINQPVDKDAARPRT